MKNSMITFAVAVFMFFVLGCTQATGGQMDVGSSAVNIDVVDLQGNSVSLDQFLGKDPVLLVFFATWCPPCRKEVPELNKINSEYLGDGLKVIATSVDNSINVLPDFMKKMNINYTVWHDEKTTASRAYGVVGIPTNILIDRNGKIKFRAHHPPKTKDIESVLN